VDVCSRSRSSYSARPVLAAEAVRSRSSDEGGPGTYSSSVTRRRSRSSVGGRRAGRGALALAAVRGVVVPPAVDLALARVAGAFAVDARAVDLAAAVRAGAFLALALIALALAFAARAAGALARAVLRA